MNQQNMNQPNMGQQNMGQPNMAFNPNAHMPRKTRIAGAIFAFMFGALGVHNFYLGHKGKAIVQLLITLLSCGWLSFISVIWAWIEGFSIATNLNYRDGNGNPLVG